MFVEQWSSAGKEGGDDVLGEFNEAVGACGGGAANTLNIHTDEYLARIQTCVEVKTRRKVFGNETRYLESVTENRSSLCQRCTVWLMKQAG